MQLVRPALERLPGYVAALRRGWSPDNVKGTAAVADDLREIAKNSRAFVERLTDRDARGPPVVLPDGTTVQRIPGYHLWLWDGEFCGSIGFRWQPGTPSLPPHVLGHIGYAVVPWKAGRGYAKLALKMMLERVRAERLPYVELTTDPDNVASQRVIEANGGIFIERFRKPPQYGDKEGFRFRIFLSRD